MSNSSLNDGGGDDGHSPDILIGLFGVPKTERDWTNFK
jgi:hypothetical protein